MTEPNGLVVAYVLSILTCRGGGIRTHGLFVPNEARYQAAPHPVASPLSLMHGRPRMGNTQLSTRWRLGRQFLAREISVIRVASGGHANLNGA